MQATSLPFNGTNAGFNDPKPSTPDYSLARPLLSFPGGIETHELSAFVGVRFDVPSGNGTVSLLLPTLRGDFEEHTFSQNGATELVAVPVTPVGISLYHVSKRTKGEVILVFIGG